MHLVDLRGCTPPATCRQQGESFCPLQHRGPVRPKKVPGKKKKKNRVRARHGLQASCQRFGIAFDAGWGTWERLPCARFAYTSQMAEKQEGILPFDHFLV